MTWNAWRCLHRVTEHRSWIITNEIAMAHPILVDELRSDTAQYVS